MSHCSDLGYKVGDMFEVIDAENAFYTSGMIVKLQEEDDDSDNPWFTYVSGPTGVYTFDLSRISIPLTDLRKVESTNKSINVTYSEEDIKAAFSDLNWEESFEGFMIALNVVSNPEYKEYLRLKAKYEN